ncbi:unnamed protein product [Sympodiomycopsis kandeliae]
MASRVSAEQSQGKAQHHRYIDRTKARPANRTFTKEPPILQRSQGSEALRQASQQSQPWVLNTLSRALLASPSNNQSETTSVFRFPFQGFPHRDSPYLPPMPPGTNLARPSTIWWPQKLDASYEALQRRLVSHQVWRGSAGAHPSQQRLISKQARHEARNTRLPLMPGLERSLSLANKIPPSLGRPQSPMLTLEAASASGLSARPSAPSIISEDAFTIALTKLHKLFAPEEDTSSGVSSSNSALNRSGWFSDQRVKAETKAATESSSQSSPIEFVSVRKKAKYDAPKLPCVFMHGLFGFSTLTPVSSLPQLTIDYWRGVVELLEENGVEVLVTNVKTSASIEERARDALEMIEERFPGREVNLLGHSMGGLDARFLTSCLKDKTFKVKSVTTIATPHLGSPFASYLLYDVIGRKRLPTLLSLVQRLGIPGGGEAFECLTTERMKEFNEYVKDRSDVKYFSWGAAFTPGLFNEFRFPHKIISQKEGHNDGLVSVESSKWGQYQGTLKATHIEIIGWGNAIQQWLKWAGGEVTPFDTRDFYLMVCEDLAREGF